MSEQRSLWERRLQNATIQLEPGVAAEVCANRYDAASPGEMEALTNAALRIAFDAGHGTVALDDLDAAAEQLEVVA